MTPARRHSRAKKNTVTMPPNDEVPPQPVPGDAVARHHPGDRERRVRGERGRHHRRARQPPGQLRGRRGRTRSMLEPPRGGCRRCRSPADHEVGGDDRPVECRHPPPGPTRGGPGGMRDTIGRAGAGQARPPAAARTRVFLRTASGSPVRSRAVRARRGSAVWFAAWTTASTSTRAARAPSRPASMSASTTVTECSSHP